jgi:hypothetical protein
MHKAPCPKISNSMGVSRCMDKISSKDTSRAKTTLFIPISAKILTLHHYAPSSEYFREFLAQAATGKSKC